MPSNFLQFSPHCCFRLHLGGRPKKTSILSGHVHCPLRGGGTLVRKENVSICSGENTKKTQIGVLFCIFIHIMFFFQKNYLILILLKMLKY